MRVPSLNWMALALRQRTVERLGRPAGSMVARSLGSISIIVVTVHPNVARPSHLQADITASCNDQMIRHRIKRKRLPALTTTCPSKGAAGRAAASLPVASRTRLPRSSVTPAPSCISAWLLPPEEAVARRSGPRPPAALQHQALQHGTPETRVIPFFLKRYATHPSTSLTRHPCGTAWSPDQAGAAQ